MTDQPLFYLGAVLVAGFIFRVWLTDLRAYQRRLAAGGKQTEAPGAEADQPVSPAGAGEPIFPGATPVRWSVVWTAIGGAMFLLAAETIGEYELGIAEQQTQMTVLFGLYTLAAAFIEELIFRGYLYYDKGTRTQLIGSIVVVSLAFAILHPYVWSWQPAEGNSGWQFWQGRLSLNLGTKPLWSTAIVFLRSLWFYWVRFTPANRWHSLIPSIAAHLSTNTGVLAIKWFQGAVSTWY